MLANDRFLIAEGQSYHFPDGITRDYFYSILFLVDLIRLLVNLLILLLDHLTSFIMLCVPVLFLSSFIARMREYLPETIASNLERSFWEGIRLSRRPCSVTTV